jgi:hypothetical protein
MGGPQACRAPAGLANTGAGGGCRRRPASQAAAGSTQPRPSGHRPKHTQPCGRPPAGTCLAPGTAGHFSAATPSSGPSRKVAHDTQPRHTSSSRRPSLATSSKNALHSAFALVSPDARRNSLARQNDPICAPRAGDPHRATGRRVSARSRRPSPSLSVMLSSGVTAGPAFRPVRAPALPDATAGRWPGACSSLRILRSLPACSRRERNWRLSKASDGAYATKPPTARNPSELPAAPGAPGGRRVCCAARAL